MSQDTNGQFRSLNRSGFSSVGASQVCGQLQFSCHSFAPNLPVKCRPMSSYLLQRDSTQIGSVFWNCRSTTNVGCPENKAGGKSKAQLKTYKVGFCGKLPYYSRLLQLCGIGYALNSPESRIRSEICLSRANPLYPAFVMSPLLIYRPELCPV